MSPYKTLILQNTAIIATCGIVAYLLDEPLILAFGLYMLHSSEIPVKEYTGKQEEKKEDGDYNESLIGFQSSK